MAKKKKASQLALTINGEEYVCSRVSGLDKRTELLVKKDNGKWARVGEFDSNEASKLFFDVLSEKFFSPDMTAPFKKDSPFKKMAGIFGDTLEEPVSFSSMFQESSEVKAARAKADAARHRAEEARQKVEEARHEAELARQRARKARAESGEEDSASGPSPLENVVRDTKKGCLIALAIAIATPLLFVCLMVLAFRAGMPWS